MSVLSPTRSSTCSAWINVQISLKSTFECQKNGGAEEISQFTCQICGKSSADSRSWKFHDHFFDFLA
ncbi:MAG: hypothetical protein A2X86_16560 [Bdellovibrionales bacterium GWA2_49_15]|nr:MAG: hypothetical protein A2X86_16560 [Bdellovibrionales bacterium GWA2_49_15]